MENCKEDSREWWHVMTNEKLESSDPIPPYPLYFHPHTHLSPSTESKESVAIPELEQSRTSSPTEQSTSASRSEKSTGIGRLLPKSIAILCCLPGCFNSRFVKPPYFSETMPQRKRSGRKVRKFREEEQKLQKQLLKELTDEQSTSAHSPALTISFSTSTSQPIYSAPAYTNTHVCTVHGPNYPKCQEPHASLDLWDTVEEAYEEALEKFFCYPSLLTEREPTISDELSTFIDEVLNAPLNPPNSTP